MIGITVLPGNEHDFLYQFKAHFRFKQSRHFVMFCWLIVLLINDQGKGKTKAEAESCQRRLVIGF